MKMKRFALTTMMTAALLLPTMRADEVIHDRKQNQQSRIAQGVKSGQLTPAETARLENREKNLNKTIRNDRAANGGKLTGQEKAKVNARQNKISNSIYKDKHNAAKQ
jgi:hypothetical protein